MEPDVASRLLWHRYHAFPWFVAVGEGVVEGSRGLHLYATHIDTILARDLSRGWMGYPIAVFVSGRPVLVFRAR